MAVVAGEWTPEPRTSGRRHPSGDGARTLGLTALAGGARAAGLVIPPSVRALLADALARDGYWPLLHAIAVASPAAITENLDRLSPGGVDRRR